MDSKIHSNLLFFLGSVDRILECMQRFMSREEIVNHLSVQFQTNPIWTNTGNVNSFFKEWLMGRRNVQFSKTVGSSGIAQACRGFVVVLKGGYQNQD
ncbi:hypothetical protein YC2023_123344 [Brassica napus]